MILFFLFIAFNRLTVLLGSDPRYHILGDTITGAQAGFFGAKIEMNF